MEGPFYLPPDMGVWKVTLFGTKRELFPNLSSLSTVFNKLSTESVLKQDRALPQDLIIKISKST